MALGHAVVNGQTGTNPDFAGALGADQIDANHPTRNRKVVGSNPTSGSKTAGQSIYTDLPSGALLAFLIIPCASLAAVGARRFAT